MGPRADLDAVAKKKKNPCPCRKSNPGRPACSSVIILTEMTEISQLSEVRVMAFVFISSLLL